MNQRNNLQIPQGVQFGNNQQSPHRLGNQQNFNQRALYIAQQQQIGQINPNQLQYIHQPVQSQQMMHIIPNQIQQSHQHIINTNTIQMLPASNTNIGQQNYFIQQQLHALQRRYNQNINNNNQRSQNSLINTSNTTNTMNPSNNIITQQHITWNEPKMEQRFNMNEWRQSTAIKRQFAFNYSNKLLSILSNNNEKGRYFEIEIEKTKLVKLAKFHKDKISLYAFNDTFSSIYYREKNIFYDDRNHKIYQEYKQIYNEFDIEPSEELNIGSLWRSITSYLTRTKPKNNNIEIIKISKSKYNDIIKQLKLLKLTLLFGIDKGTFNFDTMETVTAYTNNQYFWNKNYRESPHVNLTDLDYRTNIINIKFPIIIFEKYLPSYFDERLIISLLSIIHYISEIILKRLFVAYRDIKFGENITFKELYAVIQSDNILKRLFAYFCNKHKNKMPSYLDVCNAIKIYKTFEYKNKYKSFRINKINYLSNDDSSNNTNNNDTEQQEKNINICCVVSTELLQHIFVFINDRDLIYGVSVCCKVFYNTSYLMIQQRFKLYVHNRSLLNGLYQIWNDLSVTFSGRIEYGTLSVINLLIVNLLNDIIESIINNMNNIDMNELLFIVIKQIFFNNNTILTNLQKTIQQNLKDFDYGIKIGKWSVDLSKNDLLKISNQMIQLRSQNKYKLLWCKFG